ncbi:unnamed protein product [Heligmosomoides polygyrus]|uniref:Cyclin N-terminal domain-containing protein n=1 Tax=Heligmosomoides polygyrus TaxID=6339 RepID=A0A3P8EI77_HELPZ|nr:unnamed protein product [Heligmosomoides polygyrus]
MWMWISPITTTVPSRHFIFVTKEDWRCCSFTTSEVKEIKAWPTIGTASIYFHRFYMFHTLQEFPREIVAMGCLFLAGKVSETPKKCKDIVTAAQNVFPTVYGNKNRNAFVDEIMGIERVLLQTMKFDLQVDLPYQYLIDYSKKFKLTKPEINSLVHTSWTFVNDSAFTTLCLIWEPQVIAVALLHLSITVRKVNIGLPECWWNEYIANLSNNLIDDICHKVCSSYCVSRRFRTTFPEISRHLCIWRQNGA